MAHPDLDELLNTLLPFAQQMLVQYGEFYPFSGSMDQGGEIAHIGGQTASNQPTSQEVFDLLVEGLREHAATDELRAAAICLDVRTIPPGETKKTDAINVHLEHSSGEAVDVYLPYRREDSGEYTCGELFATKANRDIFRRISSPRERESPGT